MVERFFRDLTTNRLRGVFHTVLDLVNSIHHYVDHHNERPKPFIWTASATDPRKGEASPQDIAYCSIRVTHYTSGTTVKTVSKDHLSGLAERANARVFMD
jgi:hypothetical protein